MLHLCDVYHGRTPGRSQASWLGKGWTLAVILTSPLFLVVMLGFLFMQLKNELRKQST